MIMQCWERLAGQERRSQLVAKSQTTVRRSVMSHNHRSDPTRYPIHELQRRMDGHTDSNYYLFGLDGNQSNNVTTHFGGDVKSIQIIYQRGHAVVSLVSQKSTTSTVLVLLFHWLDFGMYSTVKDYSSRYAELYKQKNYS